MPLMIEEEDEWAVFGGIELELDTKDFVLGFARAIACETFASTMERAVEDGTIDRVPWPPGSDICEYAPDAEEDADFMKKVAHWLVFDRLYQIGESGMEEIAHADRVIESFFKKARESTFDAPKTVEDMGWQVALNCLGHGSAIADGARPLAKKIGSFETSGDVLLDDDEDVEGIEIHGPWD